MNLPIEVSEYSPVVDTGTEFNDHRPAYQLLQELVGSLLTDRGHAITRHTVLVRILTLSW